MGDGGGSSEVLRPPGGCGASALCFLRALKTHRIASVGAVRGVSWVRMGKI